MIDPSTHSNLRRSINECIELDKAILDELRAEIRPLATASHRIQPRATTSISVVATDGGNNQLQFDPFLIQLIRVVDSSNNEYCLEAISPTFSRDALTARHLDPSTGPKTALGEMMQYLAVSHLSQLSPMIRPDTHTGPISPTWVQVYRELVEWAILFSLLKHRFGTDTLIVCDGLLRSKVFSRDLFVKLMQGFQERIEAQLRDFRRNIYLAGVAKHSKVLTRYRLAMCLEQVLQTNYPAYVEVPREVEERAYAWSEFARGSDNATDGGEVNKFVGGKMFLVKFGERPRDPVWPIDIFVPQTSKAQVILGSMLADAQYGFPVPHYPRCLQMAHENAALVDFDFDILQDRIFDGVRISLGTEASVLDDFRLLDNDPASARYN